MAADLAADRYLNYQKCLVIYGIDFRLQVQRWIDFLSIIDRCNEVFLHAVYRIWGYAQDSSVVFYTQDNRTTIPVGK